MNLYRAVKVTMSIEFEGEKFTFQVNPEKLTVKNSADNKDITIIGLGPAVRKAHPGLITMQINSFFPHPFSKFYVYDRTPEESIDFINKIWHTENKDNKVPRLIAKGLDKNIDILFVITDFSYDYTGGDLDIPFSLSIKEYVPYGSKKTDTHFDGLESARAISTNISYSNAKTYTVKTNESLWSITKLFTGSGDNWKELYDLNKDALADSIITGYEVLQPGLVLIIPDNWKLPVNNSGSKGKGNTNEGNNDKELSKKNFAGYNAEQIIEELEANKGKYTNNSGGFLSGLDVGIPQGNKAVTQEDLYALLDSFYANRNKYISDVDTALKKYSELGVNSVNKGNLDLQKSHNFAATNKYIRDVLNQKASFENKQKAMQELMTNEEQHVKKLLTKAEEEFAAVDRARTPKPANPYKADQAAKYMDIQQDLQNKQQLNKIVSEYGSVENYIKVMTEKMN